MGTSEKQKANTSAARKRQPRSQEQAGGKPIRSTSREQQPKSSKARSSETDQRTDRSRLTGLLGSPAVRSVLAAGLVSAAAALLYRKPKTIAEANESLHEAADKVLNGAGDAARTTSEVARKATRKAIAVVQSGGKLSPSSTKGAAAPRNTNTKSEDTNAKAAESATTQQRTRKRRSDAGIQRPAKRGPTFGGVATGGATEPGLPPVASNAMETSAVAIAAETSQSNAEAAPEPSALERQEHETQPM